jgi:hypothetical protein
MDIIILNPAVDRSFSGFFSTMMHKHLYGEFATGRIARFLRPLAALRFTLPPKNRTLYAVQLPDLGLYLVCLIIQVLYYPAPVYSELPE